MNASWWLIILVLLMLVPVSGWIVALRPDFQVITDRLTVHITKSSSSES